MERVNKCKQDGKEEALRREINISSSHYFHYHCLTFFGRTRGKEDIVSFKEHSVTWPYPLRVKL